MLSHIYICKQNIRTEQHSLKLINSQNTRNQWKTIRLLPGAYLSASKICIFKCLVKYDTQNIFNNISLSFSFLHHNDEAQNVLHKAMIYL